MKCAICRNGETLEGRITVLFERGETTLVFKNVPAQVCENCGKEYLASDTNNDLLKKANEAVAHGVDFQMLRYAA